MFEGLRRRFGQWVLGQKPPVIELEVKMIGYDDMMGKLNHLETTLDRLLEKSEGLEHALGRVPVLQYSDIGLDAWLWRQEQAWLASEKRTRGN